MIRLPPASALMQAVLTTFSLTWEDHVSNRFFTLRITIKLSIKWQNPHWTDFEKAFDRLPYDSIWDTLKCWGIPRKIINIIKSFFGQRAAFMGQEKCSWAYVLSQILMWDKDELYHLPCLVAPPTFLRESRDSSGVDDQNMSFLLMAALLSNSSAVPQAGTKPSSTITKSNVKLIACDENKTTMRFPAVSSSKIVF